VNMYGRPMLEGAGLAGEQGEFDIDAARSALQGRRQQPVTAVDLFHGQALAGEVERDPLAGMCLVGFAILRVQAAYAHAAAEGRQREFVANLYAPGKGGAGNHHAGAGDAKGTVDGQAEIAAVAACIDVCGLIEQGLAQRLDAQPFDGRYREDRRTRQWPGLQQCLDLLAYLFDAGRLDAVDLGQRHQRPANTPQLDDGQVFAGWRHYAVTGGVHQPHAVDAAGACQHVVDEALVTRHVDKAGQAAVAEVRVGVAEVDGDAAFALFAAAVALLAGEGLEQGGLAVVDVAGGADDHGAYSC